LMAVRALSQSSETFSASSSWNAFRYAASQSPGIEILSVCGSEQGIAVR
jgi:hypothetical protein